MKKIHYNFHVGFKKIDRKVVFLKSQYFSSEASREIKLLMRLDRKRKKSIAAVTPLSEEKMSNRLTRVTGEASTVHRRM